MSEVYKVSRQIVSDYNIARCHYDQAKEITEYYWKDENLTFNFVSGNLNVFKPEKNIVKSYKYNKNNKVVFDEEFLQSIKDIYILNMGLNKVKTDVYNYYTKNYKN